MINEIVLATKKNDYKRVDQLFLEMLPDIKWFDDLDDDGNTLFNKIFGSLSYEMLTVMLKYGDIHKFWCDGHGYQTLLFMAVKFGNNRAVELLLSKGANPSHQDCLGETPLFCAILKNDRLIIKQLIKYGTDFTLLDKEEKDIIEYIDDNCPTKKYNFWWALEHGLKELKRDNEEKKFNEVHKLMKDLSTRHKENAYVQERIQEIFKTLKI